MAVPEPEIASVSVDGSLLIWDVATGVSRPLVRRGDILWDLAYSPDGTQVAASTKDGVVVLHDLRGGTPFAELSGADGGYGTVAFRPDG